MFLPDESEQILFVLRGRLTNFSCYQTKCVEEREMTNWARDEARGWVVVHQHWRLVLPTQGIWATTESEATPSAGIDQ